MDASADAAASGLLGLHQALQREGFVVGPRELLSATRLLLRLHEAGLAHGEPARLKDYLGAVYCKSHAEQQRFGAVFARWLETRSELPPPPPPPPPEPPPPAPPRPRWRVWLGQLPGLLGIVLALVIVTSVLWQPARQTNPAPPKLAQAETSAAPARAASVGAETAPSQASPPPRVGTGQPDGFAGFMPVQQVQREFQPWLVAVLLLLPAPLLLLLYAPALALSRRHLERQRRGAGVQLDVSVWRSEAERVVPAMNGQTAARLDRHLRPPFDDAGSSLRRVLDAPRTIAATLRRHGQLTLRWRARRTRPSYLVLIDVRDENDLRGRLFFRWSDRLRREGVGVEIWLFDGDPRTLMPAHQRRVVDAQGNERNAVRFEQVAQRATADSARRLIVVGDGGGFFTRGDEFAPWWRGLHWERWPERVLFTPVDSRDWGERELAIERPLVRGDPGFLVLPLEAEALDAYAVQLTTGELPPIVLSAARRYPPLIDKLPQGGLSPEAPEAELIEKLVAQLRLYLGENGLRWLAACAVPPLTRWELTLLIGQELFRSMGADDESSLQWLMQTNYARLARLPWLRSANFPDWLALRLLDELSPAEQQRVRSVVGGLLDQVPAEQADGARDLLTLDCTPPGGAGPRSATSPPDDDPARRRRQWLYLGFLDGLTPRQLAMRAPLAWRQWFAAPRAPRRGWREALRFAFEWARALTARLMWRDGRRESGSAVWLPVLSLAWMAVVVGALSWAASRPEGELAPPLANALFVERRNDAGAVSEVPFRGLAFSGDGSRFVSVDASGEIQVRRSDAAAALVAPPIQSRAAVLAAFLDGNGQTLIVVERSGRVLLRDLAGRRADSTIRVAGVQAPLIDARLSPDARRLALWSNSDRIHLVRLDEADVVDINVAGGGTEMKVAFTNEAPWLLVTLQGPRLSGFRADDGRSYDATQLAQTNLRSWLSADGTSQALELTPQRIRVSHWRMGNGKPVQAAWEVDSPGKVTQLAFAPGGRVAVAAGSGVEVWDPGAKPLASLSARVGSAQQLAFVGDGSALLVADDGRIVNAYKLPGTADSVARSDTPPADDAPPVTLGAGLALGAPLDRMVLSPQGDRLLTASRGNELRLWQSKRLVEATAPRFEPTRVQQDVAISADGRWAASAGDDGQVTVWNSKSGTPRSRFDAGAVSWLVLNGDGSRLTTLARDGRWQAWDTSAARALGEPQPGVVNPLGATRDLAGTTLASFGGDAAQLWRLDASGLQRAATVRVPAAADAALNAEGTQLATVTSGGRVMLWSVPRGEELADLLTEQLASVGPVESAPTVPAVAGQPLALARETLLAAGFALRVSASSAPTRLSAGSVMKTTPGAGSRAAPGSLVQVVVAGSLCRSGYVERGAFDGDPACVADAVRAQVLADNQAAPSRVDAKNQSFGPATCVPGYVWREADRIVRGDKFTDKVCVVPQQRQQAADDNQRQKERLAPGFGDTPARRAAAKPMPDRTRHLAFGDDNAPSLVVWGDRSARRIDVASRRASGPAVGHAGLTAAALAPGLLITAGADGNVRFWDPVTGVESLPALRHGAPIVRLSVVAGGRQLLTGDPQGRLRVWDLASRRALPAAVEQGAAVGRFASVAFDSAGRQMVAASGGPRPRVFTLPNETPGELRVVRPYAQAWAALLGWGVIAAVLVLSLTARRRRQRIDAIALRTRSHDGLAAAA